MHKSFVYCGSCGYRRSGQSAPERCPVCGAAGDLFKHVFPDCPPHRFGEQVCTAPVVPIAFVEEGAIVGDLLREFPTLAVVFASYGIDLSEASSLTVEQAAEGVEADPRMLLAELNEALCSPTGS